MKSPLTALALAALLLAPAAAHAQAGDGPRRPAPYPVFTTPQFDAAVEAGTRTASGNPGPAYWQNRATYQIDAAIDPAAKTLTATGTIRYTNNSPDSLAFVVLKLRQNVHAEGVPRNRFVAVTGGVTLSRLAVGAQAATAVEAGFPEPGEYRVDGTILTLALPAPLAPGATTELGVAWSYPIPPHTGAFRQGTDGEVVYLGYWYPQVAVYDDLDGWNTDQYLGNGEHYMGYADYDLAITAPAGHLVWATGELLNADEVLAPQTRERLDRARGSDRVVNVVRESERRAGTSTARGTGGRLTWRFRAENVRDVAVSSSDKYVWDATRTLVDRDGDGAADDPVLINAFYRPGTASWERAAEFAAFSIAHLSELLDFAYPYPHMTAVEGLISGGMEFPMMTLIGGARTDPSLFGVTYHEISHMWFPMIVGSNETAYTWMDEGTTSYNTNVGTADFFDGSAENRPRVDAWARGRQAHYVLAGTGYAVEPMRHNDLFPIGGGTRQVDPIQGSARVVASYSTPAVLLRAVEGIYGRARFLEAYRTYADRWAYKHPTPYDLFNTFEDVLGEDLDWLWRPTLFETWTLDHAVGSVEPGASGVAVTVEDRALAPFPAPVVVTYADGRTERRTVPVETWLGGATSATLTFPAGAVARVAIDPEGYLPDADPTNNAVELEGGVNPSSGAGASGR